MSPGGSLLLGMKTSDPAEPLWGREAHTLGGTGVVMRRVSSSPALWLLHPSFWL